ncbi:hypothetical protein [Pectinatus haikarae]|nr:hypothetical protein [Pectinatus haikarae]
MSVLLEGAFDGKLDEFLVYSKYDYKNKATGKFGNFMFTELQLA